MGLLIWLGLAPDEDDQKLKNLVKKSYNSVSVVGRGTVRIDPAEVSASVEFQDARRRAARLLKR